VHLYPTMDQPTSHTSPRRLLWCPQSCLQINSLSWWLLPSNVVQKLVSVYVY